MEIVKGTIEFAECEGLDKYMDVIVFLKKQKVGLGNLPSLATNAAIRAVQDMKGIRVYTNDLRSYFKNVDHAKSDAIIRTAIKKCIANNDGMTLINLFDKDDVRTVMRHEEIFLLQQAEEKCGIKNDLFKGHAKWSELRLGMAGASSSAARKKAIATLVSDVDLFNIEQIDYLIDQLITPASLFNVLGQMFTTMDQIKDASKIEHLFERCRKKIMDKLTADIVRDAHKCLSHVNDWNSYVKNKTHNKIGKEFIEYLINHPDFTSHREVRRYEMEKKLQRDDDDVPKKRYPKVTKPKRPKK